MRDRAFTAEFCWLTCSCAGYVNSQTYRLAWSCCEKLPLLCRIFLRPHRSSFRWKDPFCWLYPAPRTWSSCCKYGYNYLRILGGKNITWTYNLTARAGSAFKIVTSSVKTLIFCFQRAWDFIKFFI